MKQVYIYKADLHCLSCGDKIKDNIPVPKDFSTIDSDDYPFLVENGESDIPQYCGTCGIFLENPLTSDGYTYVQKSNNEGWKEFYK